MKQNNWKEIEREEFNKRAYMLKAFSFIKDYDWKYFDGELNLTFEPSEHPKLVKLITDNTVTNKMTIRYTIAFDYFSDNISNMKKEIIGLMLAYAKANNYAYFDDVLDELEEDGEEYITKVDFECHIICECGKREIQFLESDKKQLDITSEEVTFESEYENVL